MASGGVKLSIYSTFKDDGTKQAERAMKSFTKKFGELDEATKVRSLDSATEKLARFSIKCDQTAAKLQRTGKAMQGVGGTITKGITVPIVATGAAAIKSAVTIDTALTGVRKTVNGTEEQYQKLKQAAIDYSKTNATSADEVLNAQALGAQLGFNINELDKFSQVATGLDIATDMDMETASSQMAQFANITKMSHSEIDRYGASIVNLGNNMATTESAVSEMAQRTAAAGHQVGMSQKQILGWSGAMTSMGINAEAGGTSFSTVISNIDKEVATSGKHVREYAKLAGMSASQFSTSWKKSASDTFQAMLKGLGQQKNMSVALEDMGVSGTRATDMMKRLAGNTDLVSKALQTANDGWDQNSALTNEVANRNDSLAAKMQILKNRATAVAEEVGKPLADALLDAVDAADPLIKGVENAAKSFSDLDAGAQRQIISIAAAAAGLGPLIMGLGKVVSAAGSAIGVVGKVSATLAKMSAEGRLAGTAMTGLKGGLAGLAVTAGIAVAALAVDSWQKWTAQQKQAADASMTFADAQQQAAASGKTAGDMAAETADKMGKLQKSIADANNSYIDSSSKAQKNAATLDKYVGTIEKLTGKSKLSAVEQERLKTAVKGYNDITGSSVKITDAAKGKLNESTSALRKNAAAWAENARQQAMQELMTASIKNQVNAEIQLQSAMEQQAKAQQEWYNLVKNGTVAMVENGTATQEQIADYGQVKAALESSGKSISDLNGIIDQEKKKQKDVSKAMASSKRAYDSQKKSVKSLQSQLKKMPKSTAAIKKSGTSVGDLASKMQQAGIKAKSLSSISDAAFARMWKSCNGDVGKMMDKLKQWNQAKAKGKHVKVDASGNVVTGSAKHQVNETQGAINGLRSKRITVSAIIKRDKAWAAYQKAVGSKNALGPVMVGRSGGVFKMASGGIATGPTMLNANTLIGEAGTEAFFQRGRTATVVPLSNRHEVRPFARAVAAEMGGGSTQQTVVNNYYSIGSLSVAPGSALEAKMDAVFDEAKRLARMG